MIELETALPQGDILIESIEALPEGISEVLCAGPHHVVAHSETGHHHLVERTAARLMKGEDPFVCYLVAEGKYADIVHHRPGNNPHETVRFGGCVRSTRQREGTPEGLRQVND